MFTYILIHPCILGNGCYKKYISLPQALINSACIVIECEPQLAIGKTTPPRNEILKKRTEV